jgi:hypothetical protein
MGDIPDDSGIKRKKSMDKKSSPPFPIRENPHSRPLQKFWRGEYPHSNSLQQSGERTLSSVQFVNIHGVTGVPPVNITPFCLSSFDKLRTGTW